MKTFEEIKGQVHDASGIENPHDWLWAQPAPHAKIWFPIEKISEREIVAKKLFERIMTDKGYSITGTGGGCTAYTKPILTNVFRFRVTIANEHSAPTAITDTVGVCLHFDDDDNLVGELDHMTLKDFLSNEWELIADMLAQHIAYLLKQQPPVKKMKTKLPDAITTIAEAKAFLKALSDNGESYHPEDDATTIIEGGTDKLLFSITDATKLNNLMVEIGSLENFDPCEYLLQLDAEDEIASALRIAWLIKFCELWDVANFLDNDFKMRILTDTYNAWLAHEGFAEISAHDLLHSLTHPKPK